MEVVIKETPLMVLGVELVKLSGDQKYDFQIIGNIAPGLVHF